MNESSCRNFKSKRGKVSPLIDKGVTKDVSEPRLLRLKAVFSMFLVAVSGFMGSAKVVGKVGKAKTV